MRLNIYIISEYLQSFNPVLQTSKNLKLIIDRSRIIIDKTDFDHRVETLYIMPAEYHSTFMNEFKKYNFIVVGDLPKGVAIEDCIYIAQNVSLSLIADLVNDCFQKFNLWEEQLKQPFMQLNNRYTYPLQSFMKIATNMLKNPIAIFDISSKLLFHEGKLPKNIEGSIWEEILENQAFDIEFLDFDEQKKVYRDFSNAGDRIPSTIQEYGDSEKIAYLILFQDNQPFATIGMADITAPITDEQYSIFYHLKTVLENVNDYYHIFLLQDSFPNYILENLLRGDMGEKSVLEYHLNNLNWKIEDNYQLINITTTKKEPMLQTDIITLTQRLQKYFPTAVFFPYKQTVLAIIKVNEESISANQNFNQFLLNHHLLGIGSTNFNSFLRLNYAYKQTEIVSQLDLTSVKTSPLILVEDIYEKFFVKFLQQIPNYESTIHPMIFRLYKKGDINLEDLDILKSYLLNGCNTLLTAKKMHFHRNTLSYRIKKIESRLDLSLNDLDNQQVVWLILSCLIIQN